MHFKQHSLHGIVHDDHKVCYACKLLTVTSQAKTKTAGAIKGSAPKTPGRIQAVHARGAKTPKYCHQLDDPVHDSASP